MTAPSRKDKRIVLSLLLAGAFVSALVLGVESFSAKAKLSLNKRHHFLPSSTICGQCASETGSFLLQGSSSRISALFAAKSGEGGKKKRRRRRRKKDSLVATTSSNTTPPPITDASSVPIESMATIEDAPPTAYEGEEINVADIQNVAAFSFDGVEASPQGVEESTAAPVASSIVQDADGSIPLPDIKDTLRRKKMEIANKGSGGGGLMEDNMPKTRIDRKDRKALLKLLEQDPYADGDDSFFFEQEYTSISAWLGEGTKPFLGIPTGPLQVGHTIGALVIVLMAFIEYPGFPLTNLPTPLRGALQGGLGTIYSINALLCIVTFFKARERDQSVQLWMAKTLTVGGLALDQLSQLPTTKEIEEAKARKGKRALRN